MLLHDFAVILLDLSALVCACIDTFKATGRTGSFQISVDTPPALGAEGDQVVLTVRDRRQQAAV
ncbi:hypothetical protein [Massilia psychrophila]|uniref:Uncharacterized protein n=1 Tax=Massilia psychrophila TaxID=1603353 RepID=A0A2G8SYA7_9BURK|nr:hypothetical protein [Massilia psychrophila]PIL38776.1 hypothetical protein CR103_16215 [Massilia psychrophila]GGE73651.1 hypothetical protein GCM10008020_17860 [Massilia psychrophila]